MSALVSETTNNMALLGRFEEYLAYDDIRFNVLKHIFTVSRNSHAQVRGTIKFCTCFIHFYYLKYFYSILFLIQAS